MHVRNSNLSHFHQHVFSWNSDVVQAKEPIVISVHAPLGPNIANCHSCDKSENPVCGLLNTTMWEQFLKAGYIVISHFEEN